jgi:hypothetical protein
VEYRNTFHNRFCLLKGLAHFIVGRSLVEVSRIEAHTPEVIETLLIEWAIALPAIQSIKSFVALTQSTVRVVILGVRKTIKTQLIAA